MGNAPRTARLFRYDPSKLDLGKRIDSGKEEKTASDTSSESAQSTLNKWNGFDRPGILLPDDPKFTRIANLFYEETEKLYGTSDYYSIDPFHEAKNLPAELDFGKAGRAIMDAMKRPIRKLCGWCRDGQKTHVRK